MRFTYDGIDISVNAWGKGNSVYWEAMVIGK
jgi:hypothetical protein